MMRRLMWFLIGVLIAVILVTCSNAVFAAAAKPVPTIDCSNKKNVKKIQCVEAPKSDVEKKAVVKKPEKVRKAPTSVQKKAQENLAK